ESALDRGSRLRYGRRPLSLPDRAPAGTPRVVERAKPGHDPCRHLAFGVRGRGGARGRIGGRLLEGIRRTHGGSPQRSPVGSSPTWPCSRLRDSSARIGRSECSPTTRCSRAIFSAELGRSKPDPEAFRRLATRLEVAPDEILYFDDDATYVAGAREAGLLADRV